MKRYLIVLLFYCWAVPVMGQPAGYLRTELFNEENGLSNNIVNDFAQDANGLMWIATSNGLNRFDGKTFVVYKKNYSDKNSLLFNIVSRIAIDSKNNIWIGYASQGISCYNQVTRAFKHYLPDSSNPYSIVKGGIDEILIDNQDRLWIGIANKGLTLFEPSANKFTDLGLLPFVSKERTLAGQLHYNRLTHFILGKEGKLWMATGDGFYSYDTTAKKYEVFRFDTLPENIHKWKRDVFNSIYRLGEDDFFLAGWGTGLNHYNIKTRKWKNYLINPALPERGTSNIINDIARKSEHELWIASNDTSLCVFNIHDEKFHAFDVETLAHARLTFKGVRALFTDAAGDLWVGHQSGFNFLNQRKPEFTFIHHPVTHSENNISYGITSVFDDPLTGNTFIATSLADGLNVKRRDGSIKNYPIELVPGQEPFQIINKIFNDSRNNMWVLSRDFLYHFDRKNDRLIKAIQPLPDTNFKGPAFYWDIIEAEDGRLWIATHRHGLFVFDPAKGIYKQIYHQPGNEQSLRSNIVTGLGIDTSGNIWVGYKHHGISRYEIATGKFIHFHNDNNNDETLIEDDILTLETDKKGNVWIGSNAGLSLIETGKLPFKVNNYIKDQELLGITIVDLETDDDGNIWFSNSKGLSIFTPATKELRHYNKTNGLPAEYGSLFFSKGQNQEMILTTFAGYYRFRPELVRQIQKPAKVLITSFSSGYKNIEYENELGKNGKIILNAQDNLFTVEFVSLNFKNPGSITYAYRLNGIDDSWKIISRAGIASYTHLPGGDYVFEVRAKNPAGVWSETTRLPVFIDTPFYKTSWFTALTALLIASTIFFFYRLRVRNIEKTESLKTQFNKQIAETEMRALRAQMNPHFIFNCLNSINRYIIKNDHKTASLYLTKFAKLIRLILDNSEYHQVPLSQELEALKLYIDIEALRFDHKFSYEIIVDEELNPDSILVPPMIIQPFVENAIWHGLLHKETHGRMMIRIFPENDLLVCEIQDDGVGRKKAMELKSKSATTRKSLGLKITTDRLAILNEKSEQHGGITFEDLMNEVGEASGTKVIIKIPVDTD